MKTINNKSLSLITVANFFLWHCIFVFPFHEYWKEYESDFVRVYCTIVIVSVSLLNIAVIQRNVKDDDFSLAGYILFVLLFPLLSVIIIGIATLVLQQGIS